MNDARSEARKQTASAISFAANYDLGRDFGVNEKDWTYAVVGDFTDFDAFRTWHDDPRRRPLAMRVVPHIDRVARCVIEIPESGATTG